MSHRIYTPEFKDEALRQGLDAGMVAEGRGGHSKADRGSDGMDFSPQGGTTVP